MPSTFKVSHNSSELPLISIITICFNADKTIERTFQGMATQTYPNIEYIVIDGGSTDNTLSLIEKYKYLISYFSSEKDNGIYDAMNKGINIAQGDVIGIINADDYYAPNALVLVMRAYQINKDVDVFMGNCSTINPSEKLIRTDKPTINFEQGVVYVLHPSTFISRQCYSKYGVFNDTYKYSGDYEFFCRLAGKSAKFFHINYTLAYFRLGGFGTRIGVLKEKECLLITLRYWGLFAATRLSLVLIYSFSRRKFGVFLRDIGLKKPI
jgi:glycosyltransferase involved in cell wall biosynthesis